jgi:hypothetical protein
MVCLIDYFWHKELSATKGGALLPCSFDETVRMLIMPGLLLHCRIEDSVTVPKAH